MKTLFTLVILLVMLGCSRSSVLPTITPQQLECLNKDRAYVQRSVTAAKQVFSGREADILLYETPEGTIVGYLFEQGECSTVLTQILVDELEQAEAYITAQIKKNYGPMFITKDNQTYRYYAAQQGSNAYLVAQAASASSF